MKKVIFVLTYNEGQEWVNNYPIEKYSEYFDDPEYKIIFLDNGNQDVIKNWAEKTNSIYFASENNIGTTGGYNWFIRIGELLESPRIAIMQADVQVFNPVCFRYLFERPDGTPWSHDEFIYWPNNLRHCWRESDNHDPDCGQFFSLNPRFFIDNDYLCDENFTVTHFEATDLFIRMTHRNNYQPAKPFNLLTLYPNVDVHRHWLTGDINNGLYKINSYTNQQGLHDRWFEYNWNYFKKKWANDIDIKPNIAFQLFLKGKAMWITSPWMNEDEKKSYQGIFLHKRGLITKRNTDVGQMPYPVEYEVNRFYIENIKSKKINISEYSE